MIDIERNYVIFREVRKLTIPSDLAYGDKGVEGVIPREYIDLKSTFKL